MKWDKEIIDFGEVKSGSRHKGQFSLFGDKQITQATGSCGCIAEITIVNGKDVNFSWKADEIPYDKETMQVVKSISVWFGDGSTDFLQIKATITK